jgi:hypothetical protein
MLVANALCWFCHGAAHMHLMCNKIHAVLILLLNISLNKMIQYCLQIKCWQCQVTKIKINLKCIFLLSIWNKVTMSTDLKVILFIINTKVNWHPRLICDSYSSSQQLVLHINMFFSCNIIIGIQEETIMNTWPTTDVFMLSWWNKGVHSYNTILYIQIYL